jgi:5-methylcytosine-specific restriction endonuclease McrA
MAEAIVSKMCAKCKLSLPVTEFFRRGDRDAPRSRCKACMTVDRAAEADRNAARAREWRAADPERARASVRACYATHIEERRQSSRDRWAKDPREKVKAKRLRLKRAVKHRAEARAYREAHPGEMQAYLKVYAKANRDKFRAYRARRRAMEVAASGTHSGADIADIRRLQRDRCAVCRTRLRGGGAVDHIKALAKGGSNDRANLQLLCKPCNSRKRAKDPIDFMQELGLLL